MSQTVTEDVEFTVEEITRDNETMLRVDVIDTSNSVNRVIESTVLTQNLEAYIGSETLSENNNTEREKTFPEVSDIEPGDIVRDCNAPSWSDNNLMIVTSVSNTPANEHYIDDDLQYTTVADENPEYPADSPVITCKPTVDSNLYAYPSDRLELVEKEPESQERVVELTTDPQVA
jgi:hypothetical protein